MPCKISTEGMGELEQMLRNAGEAAQGAASAGLYEGAGVIADAVSSAVRGIATKPFRYAVGGYRRKPSPEEKALLEAAPMGVAKFKKNGISVDTSVGLSNAGYGELNGKRKPIPQIANAINHGTSFMEKQPFFRKAVSQNAGKALEVMDRKIREKIDEKLNK